jgi:hypothetical protein
MRDERLRRETNPKPVTEPCGKRHTALASQSRYGTNLFHDRAHPCADPYHPRNEFEGSQDTGPPKYVAEIDWVRNYHAPEPTATNWHDLEPFAG